MKGPQTKDFKISVLLQHTVKNAPYMYTYINIFMT